MENLQKKKVFKFNYLGKFVWLNEDGYVYIAGQGSHGGNFVIKSMDKIIAKIKKEGIYEFVPTVKGDPDLVAAILKVKDEEFRSELLLHAS